MKKTKKASKEKFPDPPKAYRQFIRHFPELGKSWEWMAESGLKGSLKGKSVRLIKLGIAIGALKEGAVRACVRKAKASGITLAQMHQVLAMAASTIGLPSSVAVFTWMQDELSTTKGGST